MARFITGISAVLSFVALVLVAISLATNFWVTLDELDSSTGLPLNPVVTNSKFDGIIVNYYLDHFGLWVGCHRTLNFDKVSCGYVGTSCNSEICWVRNDEDKQCLTSRVGSISDCPAYQATRAMTIIGTIFLIAGSSILVVSICLASKVLPSSGAICSFIGGLFLMIGFSVFYNEIYNPLNDIGNIAWSFILLIVAWPLALFAGGIGMISAFSGSKGAQQAEYEESD